MDIEFILKRLLGTLLAVILVGVIGALAYAAIKVTTFAAAVATQPSRAERKEAERVEFYRAHAEDWAAFCAAYVCEDIPQGQVVKSMGGQSYMFPNAFPISEVAGDCELRTDSRDHTEYDGRVFQRGAAMDKRAFAYYLDCGPRLATARHWEDRLLLYDGRFLLEEPGRNNAYADQLGMRLGNATVSHASRAPMLREATPDFMEFTTREGVYLSKERLFQGRYIALICADRCEMKTVSFVEDADLTTPHVDELIQFTKREGCDLFEPRRLCRDDWEDDLASVARYIRFLDAELERANVSPLAAREK